MMKKWIFFDVMGVIFVVGDDTNDLLVPYVKKQNKNISNEKIVEKYIDASLGKIKSRDFWISMGIDGNDCEKTEKEYLKYNFKLDKHVLNVLKKMSSQYNIGLISNDVSEWSDFLRNEFKLNDYLKLIIISGDVKLRKPQKQIYEYAIKQANCLPEDSVFIDDRIRNLYPALELGMNVIKFNRGDSTNFSLNFPQTNDMSQIPSIVESIFAERNNK